jgi:hypothetical protein
MALIPKNPWLRRLGAAAVMVLSLCGVTVAPPQAEARIWFSIGIGAPWGGYYPGWRWRHPVYYRPWWWHHPYAYYYPYWPYRHHYYAAYGWPVRHYHRYYAYRYPYYAFAPSHAYYYSGHRHVVVVAPQARIGVAARRAPAFSAAARPAIVARAPAPASARVTAGFGGAQSRAAHMGGGAPAHAGGGGGHGGHHG